MSTVLQITRLHIRFHPEHDIVSWQLQHDLWFNLKRDDDSFHERDDHDRVQLNSVHRSMTRDLIHLSVIRWFL